MEAHHRADYLEINKYTGVERDDVYKKLTIRNIKAHPVKYLQNCVSNVGRMLFDYPYSFFPQKPGLLLRLPPNGIIALLALFCLVPTVLNWRKMIYPVRYLLFFALLYLGGNVLGAADIRMFILIAPMLLLWIAYTIQKTVRVELFFKG